jgi:hypothetical protein
MCDFINDLKSQKGKQLEAKDVEIAALEKRIEELDVAFAKLQHCSLCRFYSAVGCQMPTKKGSAPGAHCPAQKLKGTKNDKKKRTI